MRESLCSSTAPLSLSAVNGGLPGMKKMTERDPVVFDPKLLPKIVVVKLPGVGPEARDIPCNVGLA